MTMMTTHSQSTTPSPTPPPEPHPPEMLKLMAALAKERLDEEMVPMGTAKRLWRLREMATKYGKNFKGLLREMRWEPMKARSLIGIYGAHLAGTVTDNLIREIGWTRMKLIGVKLDEEPTAKFWVEMAQAIDCRELKALVDGKDAHSEVITTIHHTPKKRDRMNVALVGFGAACHPQSGGRADSMFGRDDAMCAMVEWVLANHEPASGGKSSSNKLKKVRH